MIATVDDGRLVSLRPDKDHPLSAGFACQKGIAFTEVVNDPDRVTTPLRRHSRRRVRARRLGRGDDRHRRPADRHPSPARLRCDRLVLRQPRRVQLLAHAEPEHVHARIRSAAARVHRRLAGRQQPLRGQPAAVRVAAGAAGARRAAHRPARRDRREPDRLARQRAHRAADQGPHARHRQARRPSARHRSAQDRDRGAVRVARHHSRRRRLPAAVAVCTCCSARTSSTAPRLARQADGVVWLEQLASPFSPEATASRTGIDPDTVRALARDLARTERAAVYGRVGTSTGENGTLTTYLLDAVNLVAGNLDLPGGSMFGRFGMPGERWGNEGPRRAAAHQLHPQAVADRRLPVGAGVRAGGRDGQGDHHTGARPGPCAVRQRGQPGAVGAQRRRIGRSAATAWS